MPQNIHSMPKAEREKAILKFLDEHQIMLSPKALYDNMNEFGGITFSPRTVKRLLIDMEKRGLVERKDVGSGYYKITGRGRAYLAGELDEGDFPE